MERVTRKIFEHISKVEKKSKEMNLVKNLKDKVRANGNGTNH